MDNGYAGTYIPVFLEIGSMNKIKATSYIKGRWAVSQELE